MLGKAFNWIKQHKLITFLLVIIFFLLKPFDFIPFFFGYSINSFDGMGRVPSMGSVASPTSPTLKGRNAMMEDAYQVPSMGTTSEDISIVTPSPYPNNSATRKVIANANLSLMVKSVGESLQRFKQKAEQLGGYVISSNITRSDSGERANMEIRVPSDKLDETLSFLRENSIKVVSENQTGSDITDAYSDIEAKIAILQRNKAQFELIMEKAETVDEILLVQNRLLSLQDQIDSYKGKLNGMSNASQTSKISLYLSTDEIALPYAPNEPWRPEVIFKHAVRSLVGNLQKLGTLGIWAVVYSPVIVVVLWIVFIFKKLKRKPQA
jgi:hypothetical protein